MDKRIKSILCVGLLISTMFAGACNHTDYNTVSDVIEDRELVEKIYEKGR